MCEPEQDGITLLTSH